MQFYRGTQWSSSQPRLDYLVGAYSQIYCRRACHNLRPFRSRGGVFGYGTNLANPDYLRYARSQDLFSSCKECCSACEISIPRTWKWRPWFVPQVNIPFLFFVVRLTVSYQVQNRRNHLVLPSRKWSSRLSCNRKVRNSFSLLVELMIFVAQNRRINITHHE